MSADPYWDAGFPPLVSPDDLLPLKESGAVLTSGSGQEFPVINGIPRIITGRTEYTDSFGEQWNRYRITQLDSYTGTSITADRLKRCLGPELIARLSQPSPIQILEAGCGAGRFTEVFLQYPGARITSTDLSTAVEANQTNFRQTEHHRIVQCDICRPPFPKASYDIVLCLGVIQHTPDPEFTIGKLYEQVKPGGWLVIDHYTPSIAQYTKITALLLRPLLKRLSAERGTWATETLSKVFFPLHRMVKGNRLMQMALGRISPLLTYYQAYPDLDDRLQYEWAVLDTHDHLTDYYKHLRTTSQIQRTLSSLGATAIWVAKGGNGVEARCAKPVGA